VRFGLAQALSATANGPLALSVLALSNALVFHDVERWGSIIIHFGPALVSWSLPYISPISPLYLPYISRSRLVVS